MNDKVIEWLKSYDTGISSRAIVAVMEGVDTPLAAAVIGHWGLREPSDPQDLGRCIRLLDLAPEYRENLGKMREVSPVWAKLVDRWAKMEQLYNAGESHKLYILMKRLIKAGRKEAGVHA